MTKETNPIVSSRPFLVSSLELLRDEILNSHDDYVAVDTETSGLRWTVDRAFGVALAWDDRSAFIRNSTFGVEHIGALLRDLFACDRKTYVNLGSNIHIRVDIIY